MIVPVVWLPLGPGGAQSRGGQWDLALVDDVLTGAAWEPAGGHLFAHNLDGPRTSEMGRGAVVVVPGRYWAELRAVEELDARLARLDWSVVLVTSDEESTFPAGWQPPNGPRWTMTPRPGLHGGNRFLGEGYRPETPHVLADVGDGARSGWWFCGQANHPRRTRMVDELRASGLDGVAHVTDGFAADASRGGMDAVQYLTGLSSAKVAPAPAGPATPDSFRCYEALEAGCVPVTDAGCGTYPGDGYWPMIAGGGMPPWPVVGVTHRDWPSAVGEALDRWPRLAAECSAWWQRHKRGLAYRLADDVRRFGGLPRAAAGLADLVTVIVTASPIPSHPDLGVLTATIDSLCEQLPDSVEIVVAFDGAPPAAPDAERSSYDEAVRRATWACEHRWDQAVPLLADRWVHQSGTIAAALELVRTPLVLMVEHDTPLCGDVEWDAVAAALLEGQADLVRFHHEAAVLEPHRYLMIDETPVDFGFPALRTVQWSQRPHLARAGYYRRILAEHFQHRAGFVEDTMHSVVQTAYAADGFAGWRRHKLVLYAPPGDMKRSLHLDGRAEWDKAPAWIER